jgi:hypothetical protein
MAQHDYVIANGSGSAVRADLNDALAAIVSLNSGTSEPTDTFAYMLWADTTAGVLKIRNAANNAWITLRELDGTLTIEGGSASTPGLYFTGDANTGIYSPGADQFAIATNGVERVEWGTSEVVFNDGGGNYDFRIEGDTDTDLFFVDASADTVAIAGITHPTADGTADQSLVTNGSGTLSFAARSRLVRATAVTASGTSVTFSSIPSWARKITFTFVGLSTNGTAHLLLRIGDSGGAESTGYVSSSNILQGGTTSAGVGSTVGFVLYSTAATNILSGQITLTNYDGNAWVATGLWDYSHTTGITGMVAGYKGLSDVLDRVQILAANGTDAFDSGTLNIVYEG